tara:strand:+ start:4206 stop:4859 length:654 start_codon:yes stop_codon:yes gene_type:complete
MSLTGLVNNSGFMSLTGQSSLTIISQEPHGKYIKKLNHLKKYLNDTFVQPLLVRDLEYIKQNKYNFSYLNEQLLKFKHLDPEEVDLYLQIVRFAQEAVVVMQKNEELEEKMMGDMMMGIVTHVPAIILKPEFEIYKTFFGTPPNGKFDIEAVKTIRTILSNNLGSNYDIIKTLLLDIYEEPNKQTVGNFTYAIPYRKQNDDYTEERNHYLGNDYTLD